MGKTSTEVKKRYNDKTYNNYKIRIRKDSPLSDMVKDCTQRGELNALVNSLLENHFSGKNKLNP